ncbi:hypothetical protein BDR05DRAFT_952120 [Suillus weaverae]|nr:hypothetical protein BDR05DRAFT_952120 [Suillus weaverae]
MHKKISAYTCTQEASFTEVKAHLKRGGCIFVFFSDHSEEDSSWLLLGKRKVLSTMLGPYSGILKAATMIFLVCSSVVAYIEPFCKIQDAILNFNMALAIIFSAT